MLEVIRLFINNPLANYNYIVADRSLKTAVAIDPLDVAEVTRVLEEQNLSLVAIFVTHEHADHYQGAKPLAEIKNAPIYAHQSNTTHIPKLDIAVKEGDQISFSDVLSFRVIETPGHIKGHVSFYMEHTSDGLPRLFCGDTLFNAGVGNCRHPSGDVSVLYQSVEKIKKLPENTLIYPGHDYMTKNLEFALTVDPYNKKLDDLVVANKGQSSESRQINDLSTEKTINPFIRLNQIQQFKDKEPLDIFIKLRQLRDTF